MRRWFWLGVVVIAGVAVFVIQKPTVGQWMSAWRGQTLSPTPYVLAPVDPIVEPVGDLAAHTFRMPSGESSNLSCEAARAIITQVHRELAYDPDSVSARALAGGTADWLDPHGLWSASPDSPVEDLIIDHSKQLLSELEGDGSPQCVAARDVGQLLVRWVGDLRQIFDRERAATQTANVRAGHDDPFESGTVTRPARELAAVLGQHVGALERALGSVIAPYANDARARFFPELDADGWGHVVLAAAVRAYVPLVDPHGAWAPFDEENTVYEMDLESHHAVRLWERATRTAIGLRLDTNPMPPLQAGDVVVSLGGLSLAGVPIEQAGQLAWLGAELRSSRSAVVLREGEPTLRALSLREDDLTSVVDDTDTLTVERVPFDGSTVLVIAIRDVRDDLGDMLVRTLRHERRSETPFIGVVLDLRGNGGGSTDGAIAALGVVLPGAALFPMKRHDGSIETDRAPEPPAADRWDGPVATLVDGETASAAEMIAGAITAYRRGPSIGTVTFGKGCAQEYIEDETHTGVLRLTTLVYALPDGSPVQRVGLVPTLRVPFELAGNSGHAEREAMLPHAPPAWRGPDLRSFSSKSWPQGDQPWSAPWPAHVPPAVGPCKTPDICRALRMLSAPASAKHLVAKNR